MTREPSSEGLPDKLTGWYEFAGIVREIGFVSKATPEVLVASPTFAASEGTKEEAYLRLKF
jgi:hypothetical protein